MPSTNGGPSGARSGIAQRRTSAYGACQSFEGDALLIESEHDLIIPPPVITSYREAFRRAHSQTYRCLEGADHGLTDERHQRGYTTLLVNWFQEMFLGARAGAISTRPAAAAPSVETPEVPPHAAKHTADA